MTARELLDALTGGVSAVLTPESQRRLLEMVPPVHPVVYAHHVTLAYKPDDATLAEFAPLEGKRLWIPVVGVAEDDKAQAVLVGADSTNEYAHITISTAEGVKPAYSNTLFTVADVQHVPIFSVEADVVIEQLDSLPITQR